MWTNETIFSNGDILSQTDWVEFMNKEYNNPVDDEEISKAVCEREKHIKSCIQRLQFELDNLEELEILLHN